MNKTGLHLEGRVCVDTGIFLSFALVTPSITSRPTRCLRSQGGFDDYGDASSLKMAVVSREYDALVARQLQEQQR